MLEITDLAVIMVKDIGRKKVEIQNVRWSEALYNEPLHLERALAAKWSILSVAY